MYESPWGLARPAWPQLMRIQVSSDVERSLHAPLLRTSDSCVLFRAACFLESGSLPLHVDPGLLMFHFPGFRFWFFLLTSRLAFRFHFDYYIPIRRLSALQSTSR